MPSFPSIALNKGEVEVPTLDRINGGCGLTVRVSWNNVGKFWWLVLERDPKLVSIFSESCKGLGGLLLIGLCPDGLGGIWGLVLR